MDQPSVFTQTITPVSATPGDNMTTAADNTTGNLSQYYDTSYRADPWVITFGTCYSLICMVGLAGNGMVIYVVLRYTKMKTVTNTYILNLAVADLCFLAGLPLLVVTSQLRMWVFGYYMCKLFYILTSINWFTSVFTLIVMSTDRYLAVCHPISSMAYRTPLISRLICLSVWLLSMLVMLPIFLYATTVDTGYGYESCTIVWPSGQVISSDKAFIWYTMLLGFLIPVIFIILSYTLVLLRLRTVGPKVKSKEKQRSHRKVTKMVLVIIAVYVVCWLPYWVYQLALSFLPGDPPKWAVLVFMCITVLSYANSMLNPLIYAFLSENFRKSFIKAFHCEPAAAVNGALNVEPSVFPGGRKTCMMSTALDTFTSTTTKTVGTTTHCEMLECETVVTNIDSVMKQEESAVHEQLLGPTSL